jgi:hypothetical protein
MTTDVAESRTHASASGRRRLWTGFVVFFALAATLSTLWALASPVFSVPDENAHATKAIAQAHGQVVGYSLPGVKHIVVDLPGGYEYSPHMLCFAYHPERPADCGVELGDPAGSEWFNTWVGAYNPIYYAVIGWPSLLFDGNASIYAMRIASALLGSVLLACAFLAAVAGACSRWMPLAVAFAAAPMCVYLIGAVNPNGAELAAAAALWVGLLRLLESFDADATRHPSLPRWCLWLIVTVASIVLVNARALGPLWLVIIVALCLVAAGWELVARLFTTGRSYIWLAVIAAGGLFSIGWTLSGGSLSGQAEAADAPLVGGTFWQGFTHTLRTTPDYLHQAIGYFGWFDAPLPVWVYWFFVAAFAALVLLALAALRGRNLVVLLVVLVAAALVPALVQGYSVGQTGIIWQGRSGLFLYVGIPIMAAWMLGREAGALARIAPRLTWIGAFLLAVYGVLAFGLVLVRYVIGGQSPIGEMLSAPQWQPPLGWPTLVALYGLASLGLAVLVGISSWRVARLEDVEAEHDHEGANDRPVTHPEGATSA